MLEGETSGFDRSLLLAFRDAAGTPLGPSWVQELARDVTGLGSGAILTALTVALVGYLALVRRGGAALLVVAAVGGGAVLSTLLKLAFNRPRPDLVPHAVVLSSGSFPSGHAMLSAVTYLTLGALLVSTQRRLAARVYILVLAALITGAVGISRVYLGVHWPTDVLAGWLIGAGWALLCWLAATRLRLRLHRADPASDAPTPPATRAAIAAAHSAGATAPD